MKKFNIQFDTQFTGKINKKFDQFGEKITDKIDIFLITWKRTKQGKCKLS